MVIITLVKIHDKWALSRSWEQVVILFPGVLRQVILVFWLFGVYFCRQHATSHFQLSEGDPYEASSQH